MADSASVISSKNSEKSKLSNLINRTTSETLRLNDIEKAVNSPNSLSTNAPRKKTSFQITSVIVGSRASNDGGDDSADDLDESHAEDISEVLDNSRITDLENETPSYSEDTFSKDDVFFNASSSLVSAPVIPTSSQYGLAIVATPEHSESALNQSGNCENSDSVDVSSVDVTENVINLGVVSTKHDPEMRDMHPPAPRTERFKVVKIESTEPFKRGRWVCMDYLDHNIAQKDQPSSKADSGDNTTAVTTEVNSTAPAEQAVVNSVVEEQPQAPVPTEVVSTPASNMQANENSQVSSNQIPISSAPTVVPTSYPSVSPGQSLQSSMQMGHIINSSNATPVVSQQSQSLSQVHMQQILANSNQHQSLQPQQMQQVMASANVMPIQQQNPIPQAMQQQPVMQQPLQQMQQMHQPTQQYQSQPQNMSQQQQSVPQQQTMPQQQQTLPQQPQSMTQQQSMPAQQPSLPQQQQTIPQQQQQPQQTMSQQQQQQQPMPQPQQVLQPQQSLPQQQQTMPQQQQTIPQQQQSIPQQQQQGIPQQQQQGIPQQQQGIPQQQQGIPQQQQMPQQQGMPQQQQPMQQQQYQPMQQQQQQPMMQQQMPQQPMQNQMPVQQVQIQPGVQQMTMQQPQSQPPMQQQQIMQQPMQQMQQQQPTQMHQVSYSQPTIPNQTSQQQVPGMMPQMHPQQMQGFQQGQMMTNIQPQPIMNIQSQPHLQPQYYPVSQPMQSGIVTSQTGLMTQGTMPQVSMQGSTPNLPPLQTYASVASMPPMQVTNMPQTPPIPTSVQYNMQHMPQTSQPMTLPPMSMPQTIIPPQPQPSQQPPQQPPQPAQSYAGISSPAQSYTHGMSSSSVPSAIMMEHPLMNGEHSDNPTASLIESLNEVTAGADEIQPGEDAESTSGANAVAIDNKIEQAMDLVKSHLMYAVREEVEVLKEKIAELMDRIGQLEAENATLRAGASPETLALLPPVNQNSATNNP